MRLTRTPVAALTLLCTGLASLAAPSADEPSKRAIWVALLARSPISSLSAYHHTLRVVRPTAEPPRYCPAPLPLCDVEFRRAADQSPAARVPYTDHFRRHGELNESDRHRIGNLANGDYLVALCAGDRRISNVARLRIDSTHDPANERPLRLEVIEPAPGCPVRYLGVRGTGPTPRDNDFGTLAVHAPALVVDGAKRRVTETSGSFFPLSPGQQAESIVDLAVYEPRIDMGRPHTLKAVFGTYESDIVRLSVKARLAQTWDRATPDLPPVPEPAVALQGTVTGPDGRPAAGYEVALSHAQARFREQCDAQGRYRFGNVPPGLYALHANPPGKGQPIVGIEDVRIETGKTCQRHLSLERKFSISGTVIYADGTPAAGVEVSTTWRAADGHAEFQDFAPVDAQGHYHVGAPFALATYVGVSTTGPHPPPYHNVMAGRNDIDFILSRLPG